MMDKRYARLPHEITSDPQRSIASGLKQNILDYYSARNAPVAMKKHGKAWAQIVKDLAALRTMPDAAAPGKAAPENW